jgi:MBG domain (YGX type)/Lamin Tail Domain/NPCBM-associated, NEW3 domain of alpha-galactosidase/Alpha galactosidase A/Alpha galactosidase C-terminal beta sandwich domain
MIRSRGLVSFLNIISLPVLISALTLGGVGAEALPAAAQSSNPLGMGSKLNNPPGLEKPVLGWSSWSSFRHQANASIDEAAARELVSSGLAAEGYKYINQDDGWYECPAVTYTGSNQNYGPTVNQWGQWVTSQTQTFDTGAFPNEGKLNGMEVLANYIHSLGLKFGIYLTPGISGNAVYQNTPVEANANGKLLGTPSGYTADEITLGFKPGLKPSQYANTLTNASNYNCGGVWELNYNSPGAQAFVDDEADEFASWGVDFVKLDAIFDSSTADVEDWSKALAQTGRPIDLDITEGAYDSAIAPELDQYATQWEFTPDIEAYCCQDVLSDYQDVYLRFNAAALWQSYAGAGKGFNDLDSVEVGNGQTPGNPTGIPSSTLAAAQNYEGFSFASTDGLTVPGQETVLALWSLASSPLILGSDLATLNPAQNPVDYALLHNRQVLEVDQDAIPAARVAVTPTEQVFAKTEPGGDVVVGLFNTNYTQPEVITTSAAALGLSGRGPYRVKDLFGDNSDLCAPEPLVTSTNNGGPANPTPTSVQTPLCPASTPTSFETAGAISANVPPEGVALYQVTPVNIGPVPPTSPGSVLTPTATNGPVPLGGGRPANPAGTLPPATTLALSGTSTLTAGEAATATETFTNNGAMPARSVDLSLSAPGGWTVTPTSPTSWPSVAPGQVVQGTFSVTAPTGDMTGTVSAADSFNWGPGPAPVAPASGTPGSSPGSPGHTVTQTVSGPVTVATALVEVNEVETSTKTVPNQQFVELYNPSTSAVDVSGWKLEYATEVPYGGPTTTPIVLATIPSGTSIAAGGYYLIGGAGYVAAGTKPSANLSFSQTSTTRLSSIGGGVGIVDSNGFVVDSIGWGIDPNSGYPVSASWRATNAFVQSCPAQANGVVPTVNTPALSSLIPTSPTPASIPPGDSIVRLPDGYNTGSNCNDFSVTSAPSPGASNLVEPKLTITASSPSMTYGEAVPAITPSYSGFVNGDTAASLPIAPTCTTTANPWSPPGTYPTSCSGAADPNYTIDAGSYVNGTLTIVGASAPGHGHT